MLTDNDITNFQKIYREHFGRDISREDAFEQGQKLVGLLAAVYKPMTLEEFSKTEKRRHDSKDVLVNKLNGGSQMM